MMFFAEHFYTKLISNHVHRQSFFAVHIFPPMQNSMNVLLESESQAINIL